MPTPYVYLDFHAFNVLNPRESPYITDEDLNCAVSAPNALLGSRLYDGINVVPASFGVSNESAMIGAGMKPYFSLRSVQLKPLSAPSPGTKLTIQGFKWKQTEEAAIKWSVDFPAGYYPMFLVKFQEYSNESWDELVKVEIYVDFGYSNLDWEFCLDDLEIEFFSNSSLIDDMSASAVQVVL